MRGERSHILVNEQEREEAPVEHEWLLESEGNSVGADRIWGFLPLAT